MKNTKLVLTGLLISKVSFAGIIGYGDLTAGEVEIIQGVVDRVGAELSVVGSAASGTREIASDIDYIVPSCKHGSWCVTDPFSDPPGAGLPGRDWHGIMPGTPDPAKPRIDFKPFEPPTFVEPELPTPPPAKPIACPAPKPPRFQVPQIVKKFCTKAGGVITKCRRVAGAVGPVLNLIPTEHDIEIWKKNWKFGFEDSDGVPDTVIGGGPFGVIHIDSDANGDGIPDGA